MELSLQRSRKSVLDRESEELVRNLNHKLEAAGWPLAFFLNLQMMKHCGEASWRGLLPLPEPHPLCLRTALMHTSLFSKCAGISNHTGTGILQPVDDIR
jgi:hypothetical protein